MAHSKTQILRLVNRLVFSCIHVFCLNGFILNRNIFYAKESTGEGERCYYSGRRKVTVLDNTLATQTSFIACSSMLNDSAAGARAPLKFTTFSNKCE